MKCKKELAEGNIPELISKTMNITEKNKMKILPNFFDPTVGELRKKYIDDYWDPNDDNKELKKPQNQTLW